ncbi:hypothetical protein NEOLEDRAFT_1058963 [Neolentinus lepideus HHB14362 ss-1]|uniref:Transmembrane protein n=1 Tax=Neolentinus lepideus HHB14362 ss-1 TaxID=1314782 RepID=A0A165ULC8_9AGAM|nr:hypothetical protein NEOLEDRAFT_1058963 [Neolentinus lepideus HHB14362 ss-1]
MAGPIHYPNPPLAGRPPFATHEPDEYFSQPEPQRRIRQPPPPDPNARTSAYNVYDSYLDGNNRQSGADALGAGFMNGASDDDDDDDRNPFQNKHAIQVPATQSIPLASPKPGYAAPNPVHALNSIARPSPAPTRDGPPSEMSEANPIRLAIPPPAPVNVPSTPHPLQPPMTPITPVFARPRNGEAANGVKFETSQLRPGIMRADAEGTTLPRRGEKGDDFWRRFSMVAKADTKESFWLKKTQNGTSRMSRWVWVIGVILLACIAGAIGLGWYASHKSTGTNTPKAIGGSANEAATSTEDTATSFGLGASSSPHVSPTNTVARRAMDDVFPTPAVVPFVPVSHHQKRLNRIADLH